MADRGNDDDRVDDLGGSGGGAGDSGRAARAIIVGEDVAAFEYPRDLMLGPATPGLGQHHDWDDRADVCGGQFIVEGEEVWIVPFGGQQRTGVVDDGGHLTGSLLGLVVDQPGLDQELTGA